MLKSSVIKYDMLLPFMRELLAHVTGLSEKEVIPFAANLTADFLCRELQEICLKYLNSHRGELLETLVYDPQRLTEVLASLYRDKIGPSYDRVQNGLGITPCPVGCGGEIADHFGKHGLRGMDTVLRSLTLQCYARGLSPKDVRERSILYGVGGCGSKKCPFEVSGQECPSCGSRTVNYDVPGMYQCDDCGTKFRG